MEKYILIVEDNPFVQKLLVKFIEAANYTTVVAENGAKALELLETRPFNLITLDLEMPVMDGHQFLEKLPLVTSNTPVVVIATDSEEVKPHPQVKAKLSKPFHFGQLLAVITSCLA
jgi:CheY-like chemotaxis protein